MSHQPPDSQHPIIAGEESPRNEIPPPRVSPPRLGLGYKRDLHDPRDYGIEKLLGAPVRQDFVVPASMMRNRVGRIDQGGAGACVAHAVVRAIDMSIRAELAKLNSSLPPEKQVHLADVPKAARRFVYFNARQQEVVDAKAQHETPPRIDDHGSYPRLAMRAVQKLGFCAESVFPYSDDPVAINEIPPPTAFESAFDQLGLEYYRIATSGVARVADVARALAQSCPVVFGMFVDTAFMRNKGQTITSINTRDPNGGGHMLAVVEVTNDRIHFDNWWTLEWGDADGMGWMDHTLFGSSVITDVYAIRTTPVFSALGGTK